MTFGIYLVVSFTQVPTWIDHEAGAVPVHRAFIFTLVNARGFQQFVIRIRQQVDCETKLVAETLMRRDVIFADAYHCDVRIVKFLFGCSKGFTLDCATRRVVFRVNLNNQPFAGEVVE